MNRTVTRPAWHVGVAAAAVALFAFPSACNSSRPKKDLGQVKQLLFPAGFSSETVVSDLTRATSMVFLPPGAGVGRRMLIGQKAGLIRVAEQQSDDSWTLLADPFFNLTEVNSALDRGLLSVAVHPQFPEQPYVYAFYSFDPPGLPSSARNNGSRVLRVERFTADSSQNYNVAVPGSRLVILGRNSTLANVGDSRSWDSRTLYACQGAPTDPPVEDCIPADSDNHAGGTLHFARDGSLFVATGDATPPNGNPRAVRSQNLDSLAGKLLRIDPMTGAGLPTNPFFNSANPNANRSKLYAYGLRNPFRVAQHPTTTDMYIGDVGWETWEELNVGPPGANFGWPCYEGGNGASVQQSSYASQAVCLTLYAQGSGVVRAPIYGYQHLESGPASGAIILGSFYTGTAYPAEFRGGLFFYDFNMTFIRVSQISGNTASVLDFATDAGGDNDYDNGIVQMVSGPDSDLYTVNLGTIQRIRFDPSGNSPPAAKPEATPASGRLPLTVQFDGSQSSDPEGQPLTFEWDFGDGASADEARPSHTYTNAGTFDAKLSVRDPQGATGTATVRIYAGNTAPVVTIESPTGTVPFAVDDTISFSGTATDAESGDLSDSMDWEVLLRHNDHTHFDVFTATGASGSFTVTDHGDLDWSLEICAKATDAQGLATAICRDLPARTALYGFESNPSGLLVAVGGAQRTTPFTVAAVVNSNLQIAAPSPQAGLTFQSWSDGGEATHGILIGATSQTLVATYGGAGGSGAGGGGSGATSGAGGSGASVPRGDGSSSSEDQGCACEVVNAHSMTGSIWFAGVGLALLALRRRRPGDCID